MPTKEEIWEEIDRIILLWQNDDTRTGGQNPTRLRERIQEYEDSVGVVIKVDGELPKVYDDEHPDGFGLPSWCTEAYKKAGYVKTKPLI